MTQKEWRELSVDDQLAVFSSMTRTERNALKLLEEGDDLAADDEARVAREVLSSEQEARVAREVLSSEQEARGLIKPRPTQPALI